MPHYGWVIVIIIIAPQRKTKPWLARLAALRDSLFARRASGNWMAAAPWRSRDALPQRSEHHLVDLEGIDDEDGEYSGGSTVDIVSSPPPPYYRTQDPPNPNCKRCRSLGAEGEPQAVWKRVGAVTMAVGAFALCLLLVAWYRADAGEVGAGAQRRYSGWERDAPHPSMGDARGPGGGTPGPGKGCPGCPQGSRCRRAEDSSLLCAESCFADEFSCRSGLCVSKHSRCDGLADCDDLSDETGCPCDEDVGFRCGLNTSCLPLDKRCDGRADCWDIADEVNCPFEECPPGDPNPYHCHSWHCISSELVCDGEEDCDDGSDEGGCPQREPPLAGQK